MITGMQLKRISPQIFAYSAQYQVPFYGRTASIEETRQKAGNLQPGQVLIISQPLGTGKTFLVTHMISKEQLDVPRGSIFLTARGIADNPDAMDSYPGDILIVDETDIKSPYKKLKVGMAQLQDFLDNTGKRAIVLGDFVLRNEELRSIFHKPEQVFGFESLDEGFLRGALEMRLRTFAGNEQGGSVNLDQLISEDLIKVFTPDWILSVNSFRGVFSLLQEVVADDRLVKINNNPVKLELSMIMEHLQRQQIELDTEEQEEYLRVLQEYIRDTYPMGRGLTRGFTKEELYQLAEAADIDVDYDDFEEEILDPLALEGLLISNGIPKIKDGTFIRRPLPMVPSLKLLLSAQ